MMLLLTTGLRITFGFVFFFPLLNGLQTLFTCFFATFDDVGLVVFSKLSAVVCTVLIVGPLVVLAVKVALLIIMIGLFVVVVFVVVGVGLVVVFVVVVGLVVVLQSRAPILLSSSQSEGDAT